LKTEALCKKTRGPAPIGHKKQVKNPKSKNDVNDADTKKKDAAKKKKSKD